MLDFTIAKYKEFCKSISNSDYKILKLEDFFQRPDSKKFIILRHDVDRNIEKVLRMAKLENFYGLKATYYFRHTKDIFKPEIIKEVSSLGHEIGYHYEVLYKAKGDKEKALNLFRKELEDFRRIVNINTISMHGNALSNIDNRDIWASSKFDDFGILGEAYLSIDFSDITYFTDTARKWNGNKYNIRDYTNESLKSQIRINSTNQLMHHIKQGQIKKIYINTHPKKWSASKLEWFFEELDVSARNAIKFFYKKIRNPRHIDDDKKIELIR